MAHYFDPGPDSEPFFTLVREYPGEEAYPAADFRLEWGPIFHRGRLDGSARLLIVGQDPGQHESIARRILVGEAGQRVQGFLAKLGMERSYLMVNAFLYSVYGQDAAERHGASEAIAAYRERWLDAILESSELEGIVAFGHLARESVERWRQSRRGRAEALHFEPLLHPPTPTPPLEGDSAVFGRAMRQMLGQWNQTLARLKEAIRHPDIERELVPYGREFRRQDAVPLPEADLPADTPAWMRSPAEWAVRKGRTNEEKRATVVVTVPKEAHPWHA